MNDTSRVFISGLDLIKGSPKSEFDEWIKIDSEAYTLLDEPSDYNYCDRLSKMMIYVSSQVLTNAGITTSKDKLNHYGLVIGTEYGPLDSIHQFDMTALTQGALRVNPGLFPNTVLNSAACRISIRHSIDGPVHTVYNGQCSSLDAIGLAYNYVKNRELALVIAGGADDINELTGSIHQRKTPVGEACGFAILESEESLSENKRTSQLEILYYKSVFVCSQEQESFISEAITACSKMVNQVVDSIDSIECVHLASSCPPEIEERLINSLQLRVFSNLKITPDRIDWLGANCMVNLHQLISKNDAAGDGISIVINLDNTRLSLLAVR